MHTETAKVAAEDFMKNQEEALNDVLRSCGHVLSDCQLEILMRKVEEAVQTVFENEVC